MEYGIGVNKRRSLSRCPGFRIYDSKLAAEGKMFTYMIMGLSS